MTEQRTDQHEEQTAASGGKKDHDLLETAAQAIGSTLGSIAVKTGLAKPSANGETHEPNGKAQEQKAATNGGHSHRPTPKRQRSRKKK